MIPYDDGYQLRSDEDAYFSEEGDDVSCSECCMHTNFMREVSRLLTVAERRLFLFFLFKMFCQH
jgi:hypothetical protein